MYISSRGGILRAGYFYNKIRFRNLFKILLCIFAFFIILNCTHTVILKERPGPPPEPPYKASWSRWAGLEEVFKPRVVFDNVNYIPGSVIEVNDIVFLYYSGYDGINWKIGRLTSADGISFSKGGLMLSLGTGTDFDSHGVRDPMVAHINDKYYMWYTGINSSGNRQIGLATSIDGSTWNKVGVTISRGYLGTFYSEEAFSAKVIVLAQKYIMYFVGKNDVNETRVLAAETEDLDSNFWTLKPEFSFTSSGTSSGLFSNTKVDSLAVYYDRDSRYVNMWLASKNGANRMLGKALANLNEPYRFAFNLTQPFLDKGNTGESDGTAIFSPAFYTLNVPNQGQKFYIYYAGYDGTNEKIHISSCQENNISDDCLADLADMEAANENHARWVKNGVVTLSATSNFDSLHASEPSIVYREDQKIYYLFYKGYDGTDDNIGLAVSNDRYNWERKGIVIKKGDSVFDGKGVFQPSAFYDSSTGVFKVYYRAVDSSNVVSICYAESKDGSGETFNSARRVLALGSGFDSKDLNHPSVIKTNTGVDLYYIGSDGANQGLGRVSSADGITFGGRVEINFGSNFKYNVNDIDAINAIIKKDSVGKILQLYYSLKIDSKSNLFFSNLNLGTNKWTHAEAFLTAERVFEQSGFLDIAITQAPEDTESEFPELYYLWYTGYDGTYESLGHAILK